MIKIQKVNKDLKKRITAVSLSLVSLVGVFTFSSCKKEVTEEVQNYEEVENNIDKIRDNIKGKISNMSLVDAYNAAIILDMNEIVKRDSNDKYNADIMSKLTKNMEPDALIDSYCAVLDNIENEITINGNNVRFSEVLPETYSKEKEILSKLEDLVLDSLSQSKETSVKIFEIVYDLFVLDKNVEVRGTTFATRDLSPQFRALANHYAKAIAYNTRNFIDDKKYEDVINSTNGDDWKSQIFTELSVLDNQIQEKSTVDAVKIFNNKYTQVKNLLNQVMQVDDNAVKALVNYLNIDYLNMDEVSYSDKFSILGDYSDESVSLAIDLIDRIMEYNKNNLNNMVAFSKFLVDEYKAKDKGEISSLALDNILYSSLKLYDETRENVKFSDVYLNPNFKELEKYLTKQDTKYSVSTKEHDIDFQSIGNGANFVNFVVILNEFNYSLNIKELDSYKELAQDGLKQEISSIRNYVYGECYNNFDSFQKKLEK